jgi:N-methylhydantoinase A
MSWSIGVDAGGTFTDFFARDAGSGRVVRHKRPSTPDDPGRAILDGLEELAAKGFLGSERKSPRPVGVWAGGQ